MPFSTLRAPKRHLDKIAVLKEALRRPDYAPNPDQIFDNLDGDPQIPNRSRKGRGSRSELLRILPADLETARLAQRAYALKHQWEGRRARKARFGQVCDLENLVHALQVSLSGYSLADLRAWLLELIELKDGPAKLEVQRAALGGIRLSTQPMWSFHCDGAEHPPGPLPMKRSEVIARLGLHHLHERDCVVVFWTHRLPTGMAAYRPTAWDTQLAATGWRPTGRTEPLDGSGPSRGFPEVVHAPITGNELLSPIVRIPD